MEGDPEEFFRLACPNLAGPGGVESLLRPGGFREWSILSYSRGADATEYLNPCADHPSRQFTVQPVSLPVLVQRALVPSCIIAAKASQPARPGTLTCDTIPNELQMASKPACTGRAPPGFLCRGVVVTATCQPDGPGAAACSMTPPGCFWRLSGLFLCCVLKKKPAPSQHFARVNRGRKPHRGESQM